jgi:hypothetical protein
LSEEAMAIKEECVADKSKTLAIFKLSSQSQKLVNANGAQVSNIDDDTFVLLQMIEEIKQASISKENPLHTLRSNLLGLSFLPGS